MSNNTIKIKRTSVSGRVPNTSQLTAGELGLNMADQILYASNGSVVFPIGSTDKLSSNGFIFQLNANGDVTLANAASFILNGSVGTNNQLVTSNGSATIWADPPVAVNTAAQYVWTNNHTFTSNLSIYGNLTLGNNNVVTTDAPILNASQTWNAGSNTVTALKLNVTDTTSNAASLLMDLQVGGTSKLSVNKSGTIVGAGGSIVNDSSLGGQVRINGSNYASMVAPNIFLGGGSYNSSPVAGIFNSGNTAIVVAPAAYVGWTNNASLVLPANADTKLYRDAAGTLALRNSTNAQTKRIYGTYTDASNYERGYLTSDTNGFTLGTEAAGTGVKRPLRIVGPSLASAEAVSALELLQTWNTSGTPTAFKVNVTNASGISNNNARLFDFQEGGVSQIYFSTHQYGTLGLTGAFPRIVSGNLSLGNAPGSSAYYFNMDGAFLINTTAGSSNFVAICAKANANLRLGLADAASPVAQTLSVQSVVAGTSNTAGANWTFTGSQGTGTGAGGSIIFQVAPAGSTGSAQNALVDVLTINASKRLIINGPGDFTNFISYPDNSGILSYTGGMGFRNSDSSIPIWTYASGSDKRVTIGNGYFLGINGSGGATADPDVKLYRDTVGVLAQRNGVNAQTFRLYNTYTDASNYERAVFDWTTTANTLTIGTQNAGTGTTRNLQFVVGGVNVGDYGVTRSGSWTFSSPVANSENDIQFLSPNATYVIFKVGRDATHQGGMQWDNTNGITFNTFNNDYPVTFNGSVNNFAPKPGLNVASITSTTFKIYSTYSLSFDNGSGTSDLFLTRKTAANLRLGAADAASPVAQTLSVQSVVAGTTDTAGANLTITGSQGTGTGAGGSLIFQVAPAGTTANTQNALATALTIASDKTTTLQSHLYLSSSSCGLIFPNAASFVLRANASDIAIVDGGSSIFTVSQRLGFGSTASYSSHDTYISRKAAANIRLGNADAASPVAQTLSVQSVVAGTANTPGVDFTITASQGTGTGAGGNIVFQVAPAGSTGNTQNALANAMTIDSSKNVTVAGRFGYSNSTNFVAAYTYYNAVAGSLDTVFA